MPIPVDGEPTLSVLLDTADDREDPVIRAVALRASLLQQCRCGWYNPVGAERCGTCRTCVLPETEPRIVPALGLVAVRDYLGEAHADGDARFVAACRAGICGGLAFDVADDVLAGAEHYSYCTSWPVIAEEIVAGVEARAAAHGAARIVPETSAFPARPLQADHPRRPRNRAMRSISMSTIPAPPPTPAPVGATVHLLHRWDRHTDETTLYRDYPAALAALAGVARAEWSDITHRADVPASSAGLSDAEAVITFYGGSSGAGGPNAPTSGESFDAGFEIVEEIVAGHARSGQAGTELVLASSTRPALGIAQERAERPGPASDVPVEAVSQLKDLLAWYNGDGEMRYRDTVEDGRHDNGRRAGFAALAVLAYAFRAGSLNDRNDEEPATVISDLLGDLRHLADSLGLDFAELDRHGEFHYVPELHGDF